LVVTRTPLRVSFAGGGTDLSDFYEHGHGTVFSTTIDKYIYVTVKRHGPVFDEQIRLNYSKSEQVNRIDEIENDIARECLRFLEIEPPIYVSTVADLPASVRGVPSDGAAEPPGSFRDAKQRAIERFERQFIHEALARHHGNISKAAEDMGMYRQHLQLKLAEYGIDAAAYRER